MNENIEKVATYIALNSIKWKYLQCHQKKIRFDFPAVSVCQIYKAYEKSLSKARLTGK